MPYHISPHTAGLFLLSTLIAMPTLAEVFQWTDDSGQVHFGDRAPNSVDNLQAVELPPGPTEEQVEHAKTIQQDRDKFAEDLTAERKKREAEKQKLLEEERARQAEQQKTTEPPEEKIVEKKVYVPVYPCNRPGSAFRPCTQPPHYRPPYGKPPHQDKPPHHRPKPPPTTLPEQPPIPPTGRPAVSATIRIQN